MRHLFGLEVFERFEIQVDLQLACVGVVSQFVFYRECRMGSHAFQHAVEVVGRHLDESPVLQSRQRLSGLPAEVRENSHDKGEFLYFNGVAHFYVVSHMNSWWPDALQLLMHTFFGHSRHLAHSKIEEEPVLPKLPDVPYPDAGSNYHLTIFLSSSEYIKPGSAAFSPVAWRRRTSICWGFFRRSGPRSGFPLTSVYY